LRRVILFLSCLYLALFYFATFNSHAENIKIFKTRYADIKYVNDKALGDFLWRIGGKGVDFNDDPALAKSRVDRIIDRVMDVLDMHPRNFRIKVFVYSKYEDGRTAFYAHKKGSITVYADRVTDGIFAHEIAHAVICRFFTKPPPKKIQEILAQYVDKHLWSDYF